jgi:hypothetical protein
MREGLLKRFEQYRLGQNKLLQQKEIKQGSFSFEVLLFHKVRYKYNTNINVGYWYYLPIKVY